MERETVLRSGSEIETEPAYTASDIVVLDGLEAVRRRPGMYIGDVTDGSGLHHMLWEVVTNSLDEHLAGYATRLRVSVEGSLAEVEDDGRGIPVDWVESHGASALEIVLTRLFVGSRQDGLAPHVHVAPGVGLAPVNALSEVLEVEVRRNGYVWRQRYARGKPVSALERGQRTERTGTTLRFQVDRAIFGALAFDRGAIQERLEELAIWNPKLEIELMARTIREPRGTVAWLDRLASQTDAEPPPDPCVTRALRDGVLVDVAFGWARTSRSEVRSFVGQHETEEGGSHEGGFWAGVVTALVAHRSGAFRGVRPSRLRDRLAPGLFAVVHVCLPDPRYAGSIRACLASDVARRAVRAEVHEAFGVHLSERPALVRRLLARLDG